MNFYNTILIGILLNLHQIASKKYDNYTLFRGIPVNEMHLKFYGNLSTKYEVTFWRKPGNLNMPVDFVISPNDYTSFMQDVEGLGLYVTTVIENVQQAFDQQTVKSYIMRRTESFDWNNYYRLHDIYNWLKDLSNVYPHDMTITSIGKTYEKRDIIAVKINLLDPDSNTRSSNKSKVIIEGGIHAREWISTAFVTYLINSILHGPFSTDAELKIIAYLYEWHFVPVLNPDGYEYTHTTDRMWRKNRNANNIGVDLNRNFGYHFGTKGISLTKSDDTYCGPKAFSENESKAMSEFIKSHSRNLEFYFAFHAYGQYIIIPYADSKLHTENFDKVKLMAGLARLKIRNKFGTSYTVGTAYDTVGYMTSGISGDWVKSTFGVNVVCTFELRDSGRYGFALPPNMILPTCVETLDAVKSLVLPRTRGWEDRLRHKNEMQSGQMTTFLDTTVIVLISVLFIIMQFY